jgi:membrane-bound lytic murein transglycosylase F
MSRNTRHTQSAYRDRLLAIVLPLLVVLISGFSYHWPSSHTPAPQLLSQAETNTLLEDIYESGTLKVVTRINPTTYYEDKYGPAGFEYTLASEFARELGVDLEIQTSNSLQGMFNKLDNGAAHLVAAGLTITEQRSENLAFSAPYLQVNQQVIYRAGHKKPRDWEDLADGKLVVLANSSHAATLRELQRAGNTKLKWSETDKLDTAQLMKLVQRGEIDYTIVDSNEFLAYHGLFPRLRIAFDHDRDEQFGWALAKNQANGDLHQAIQAFFQRIEEDGTLDLLKERFYGHAASVNQSGMHTFAKNRVKRLPRYEKLIKKVAAEFDMDWNLLAAIGYQESHWNPEAVSPTGVRGMMMLTRSTAKEVGVSNRVDAEQSLRGGATYFQQMLRRVSSQISGDDRTWFALAAYNVGLGHLNDARKLTQLQGGDPNKWVDVEERLPLLQQKEWYKQTRYGYARGNEPVQYVRNIRLYYNILALADVANVEIPDQLELVSYQFQPSTEIETTVL